MPDPTLTIRVLVVDDDPLVRELLRSYLAAFNDLEVVGMAADGLAAKEAVAQTRPDVALLDVQMPRLGGIEVTEWIRTHHPDTKVIMLTAFDASGAVRDAVARGANGFLLKAVDPHALADAVRAAHRGLHVMSPSSVGHLRVPARAGRTSAQVPTFSERERLTLAALCRGESNAQIAEQQVVSASTVKASVASLMRKFGASSRLDVVARAHRLGLDGFDDDEAHEPVGQPHRYWLGGMRGHSACRRAPSSLERFCMASASGSQS